MARRRSSGFEDIAEVGSRFPWWVGVLIALLLFVGLRMFAQMEDPALANGKMPTGFLAVAFLKGIAEFAQWVLPLAVLLGATASAMKQRKRHSLHTRVAENGTRVGLVQMSWKEFEHTVGEYFRRRGFAVAETVRGADGGVDLVLSKGSDRYLVQCKQWRARSVGVEKVRELYGVMSSWRAAGGFVVTSGTFTMEAKRFAAGTEIELIEGDALVAAIGHQAGRPVVRFTAASGVVEAPHIAPQCPKCESEMVRRTARVGANAGQAFWGCSRYPGCKGTRPT